MKRFRLPFECERTNRQIRMIDSAIAIFLVLIFCFSPIIGVQGFLKQKFGLSEFWADATVAICVILLMYLEQFITYQIDKRISK